jgi:hypothetical protein
MRFSPSAIIDPAPRKLLLKINRAIEMQTSIRVDINIQRAIISWCVDESDVTGLHKVIGDNDVFLIRDDLDVVWSNGWLCDGGVVETLDVGEVADIKGGDVIVCCEGEVCEFSVLGDVGAGG